MEQAYHKFKLLIFKNEFLVRPPPASLQAEDAVCLADYCDIMRCEVLQAQYEKQNNAGNGYFQLKGKSIPITDLEVWREPSQRTALSVITGSKKSSSTAYEKNTQNNLNLCDK